jgi:hypothetical protein
MVKFSSENANTSYLKIAAASKVAIDRESISKTPLMHTHLRRARYEGGFGGSSATVLTLGSLETTKRDALPSQPHYRAVFCITCLMSL